MSKVFQKYYSKILLFGEYTIIHGAQGLAVPLGNYYMQFTFEKDDFVFEKSNDLLLEFYHYVSENFSEAFYDLDSFKVDINNGLMVCSTIPIGFGLGSSGALVASFFDAYCIDKQSFTEINKLKIELGRLESYFHGSSSGLDPLVSYLKKPVHIINKSSVSVVGIDPSISQKLGFFLINSGLERRTAPLVDIYKEKIKSNHGFKQAVDMELIPLNNDIISAYLVGDVAKVQMLLKKISMLQNEYFNEMIPDSIKPLFSELQYTIKICGAGGGGFFLGMGSMDSIANFSTIKL